MHGDESAYILAVLLTIICTSRSCTVHNYCNKWIRWWCEAHRVISFHSWFPSKSRFQCRGSIRAVWFNCTGNCNPVGGVRLESSEKETNRCIHSAAMVQCRVEPSWGPMLSLPSVPDLLSGPSELSPSLTVRKTYLPEGTKAIEKARGAIPVQLCAIYINDQISAAACIAFK